MKIIGKTTDVIPVTIVFLSCVLCIFIYWPGLYGPLVLDDQENLNFLLQSEIHAGNWYQFILSDSGLLKRPVAMASFIFNAMTSGNDLFYWKFTNLLIHVLNGLLVFVLSCCIFSAFNIHNKKDGQYLAAFTSGLWLLHPLHVSTVLYLVQRMTQLSALFIFIALILYFTGRQRQVNDQRGNVYIIVACLVFFPLSIFSKENGLLFPVYILLIELIIFKFRLKIEGNTEFYKNLVIILGIVLITYTVYFISNFNDLIIDGYAFREFTPSQRVLTEFRVIIIYLSQLLIPIQSKMGFIHDDIIISNGLLTPVTTLISLMIIVLIVTLSWLLRKNMPMLMFGVLFFFCAHSMESTIFALEIMFEHRNYLPAFGIIIGATSLINKNQKYLYFVPILFMILFTCITSLRVQTWSTINSFYAYIFSVHPDSRRLAQVRARILTERQEFESAFYVLEKHDNTGAVLQKLNIVCARDQTLDEYLLLSTINKLIKPVDMYAMKEISQLSGTVLEGQCQVSSRSVINILDKLLGLPVINDFQKHKLLVFKAYHLWEEDEIEMAMESLVSAYNMVEDDPIPLFIAAEWAVMLGDNDRAIKYLNELYDLNDKTIRDYSNEIDILKEKIYKN